MNILFVNPACLDTRITDADARVVPMGLYYMAALLLDRGYSAQILNLAQFDNTRVGTAPDAPGRRQADPVAVFRAALEQVKPDIIGFSVTNANRINAQACARAARALLPGALILFGGPAPTFMADHLLTACPEIDYIIRGEGELACLKLVQAHEADDPDAVQEIPGLVYRSHGQTVSTGPAEPVKTLDDLPHPSDWFSFQHISMSRGCPGNCTFCGSPMFWGSRQVRFHSPDWLAQEVRTLARKGQSHFFISDDTFTMDRDRVIAFCRLLMDADLSITWNAISRVDFVDPEMLSFMRQAGCIQLSFGVESGAGIIKKRLGKPVPNDTAIEAFAITTAHGIMPRAYFIYGSPGETPDTVAQSIDLLKQLRPLAAVFYMLVIFPGTFLFRHAVQKGLVPDDIWQREIEDLPWFQVDEALDFEKVQGFGRDLRQAFYENLPEFAQNLSLKDDPLLYPFHADFLSRLAMTFSHGDYARDSRIPNPFATAETLYQKALDYHPDLRAFTGLAMVLEARRAFSRALTVLEQGLARFPDSKDLTRCRERCRRKMDATP